MDVRTATTNWQNLPYQMKEIIIKNHELETKEDDIFEELNSKIKIEQNLDENRSMEDHNFNYVTTPQNTDIKIEIKNESLLDEEEKGNIVNIFDIDKAMMNCKKQYYPAQPVKEEPGFDTEESLKSIESRSALYYEDHSYATFKFLIPIINSNVVSNPSPEKKETEKTHGMSLFGCRECSFASELITNVNLHLLTHESLTEMDSRDVDLKIESLTDTDHLHNCTEQRDLTEMDFRDDDFKNESLTEMDSRDVDLKNESLTDTDDLLNCTQQSETEMRSRDVDLKYESWRDTNHHLKGTEQRELTEMDSRDVDLQNEPFTATDHLLNFTEHNNLIQMDSRDVNDRGNKSVGDSFLSHQLLSGEKQSEITQMDSNDVNNFLKCRVCHFIAENKSMLNDYVQNYCSSQHRSTQIDSNDDILKCTYCDKFRTNMKSNPEATPLKCRVNKIPEEQYLECTDCSYKSTNKLCLQRHYNITHGEAHNKKILRCNLGSYNTDQLNEHLELRHHVLTEDKLIKTNSKVCLTKHEVRKHTSRNPRKDFRCRVCSYETPYEIRLRVHFEKEHKLDDIKPFKCSECAFQTNRSTYLKNHVILHHTNPDPSKMFKCEKCSFITPFQGRLKFHLKAVHENVPNGVEPIKCNQCEFQTNYKAILTKHELQHANLKPIREIFRCRECSYETPYEARLRAHFKNEHKLDGVKAFKCGECAFQTNSNSSLKRHGILQHTNKPDPSKMFKCEKCSFITPFQGRLKVHLKNVHENVPNGVEPIKCNQCEFQTNYKAILTKHELQHANLKPIREVFRCRECSYETPYEARLRAHFKNEHKLDGVKAFKCGECAFQTNSKTSLKRHGISHHTKSDPSKMFKCDKCSFVTPFQDRLKGHFKYVHEKFSSRPENRHFKCKSCDFVTQYIYRLKRHKLKHLSPSDVLKKCLQCSECSYKTMNKQCLTIHKKVKHGTVEVLKCDRCDFETKYKNALRKHKLMIHTDPKKLEMFRCNDCSFQSKYKDSLVKHITLTHRNPKDPKYYKYNCGHCSYISKKSRHLKRHLLKHSQTT